MVAISFCKNLNIFNRTQIFISKILFVNNVLIYKLFQIHKKTLNLELS